MNYENFDLPPAFYDKLRIKLAWPNMESTNRKICEPVWLCYIKKMIMTIISKLKKKKGIEGRH